MGQFASHPRDDTSLSPDSMPGPSQTKGNTENGMPIVTRIRTEGGKTATVTITLQETALTSALATTFTTSSLLPIMTTMMTTELPSLTTSMLSSTEQNTPLPESTGSPYQEPHVTLPRNTLIIIISAVVGGIFLFLMFLCIMRAYMRRRHAIKEDAAAAAADAAAAAADAAAAGIQEGEQGKSSRQHFNDNGHSMAMSQATSRAYSKPDLSQQYHASSQVANTSFRTLPAAYPAYESHPARVVAELPAELHGVGHPDYVYRG
ncbi:hypothetical protein CSAL01_01266 [Colletotrichum salicis]|uniref:Uncharacterized protein n=1 Tax=Colletotrichum salicis TaxID=1209931 RepID=A0A135UVU4_9PEZI|nr:hypothetical protein CSAL01_01266 [Colletotrichum salicis]